MNLFQRIIDRITKEIDYIFCERSECMWLVYEPDWPTWRFSINESAECDSIKFGRFEFHHDFPGGRKMMERLDARRQEPQSN